MDFSFDPVRTTQAVGVLLGAQQGVAGRSRTARLLYIADRELLAATGRILTGDRAVATNRGPVLVRTHKLLGRLVGVLSGSGRPVQRRGTEIILKSDPGRGHLTPREVDKLDELLGRFRGISTNGIAAMACGLPEYVKNFQPDQIRPIAWEAVLEATVAPSVAASYRARRDEQELLDSIFGAIGDARG